MNIKRDQYGPWRERQCTREAFPSLEALGAAVVAAADGMVDDTRQTLQASQDAYAALSVNVRRAGHGYHATIKVYENGVLRDAQTWGELRTVTPPQYTSDDAKPVVRLLDEPWTE